ncbi:MAG: hypothetical protein AAF806_12410 [Bacteroidota bacterium]
MKILIAKVLVLGLLSVSLVSCEKDEFSEYYDVLYEIKYSGDVQLEYIRYRDYEGEKKSHFLIKKNILLLSKFQMVSMPLLKWLERTEVGRSISI